MKSTNFLPFVIEIAEGTRNGRNIRNIATKDDKTKGNLQKKDGYFKKIAGNLHKIIGNGSKKSGNPRKIMGNGRKISGNF